MANFALFNNLPFDVKTLIVGQVMYDARGTERHISLQCMYAYAERAYNPIEDQATLFSTGRETLPSSTRHAHRCFTNPEDCYTLKDILQAAHDPSLPDAVVARIAFLANFTKLNIGCLSAYNPNHDFCIARRGTPCGSVTHHVQPEDFTTGASYVSKAVRRAFDLCQVNHEFANLVQTVACGWQRTLVSDLMDAQERLVLASRACKLQLLCVRTGDDSEERERRLDPVVAGLVAAQIAKVQIEAEIAGLEELKQHWLRLDRHR